MSGARFLFAIHNHQPVGNFEDVFVRAFRDCYVPFLETVARHPRFRFSAHFSGPLWEFMQAREKGCWDLVAELARRGQMELLSGGFYEPVLAIIPEEDRLGQIRMMNDFLRENFGAVPRGLWLTERVWEPQLAKTLAGAGIAYTLLDEEHFLYAGADRPYASYITEDEGRVLRVFPIDKRLRYLIPFRGLDDVRAHFDAIRAAGGIAILGDDGEKFGLWPGTRRWVYDEGWLERFLVFLEESEIRTSTFAEALEDTEPAGRIYFPPASYEEMMEWVLEPEAQVSLASLKAAVPPEARRFVRGGLFRDFCRKYSEANALHKRMIGVSRSVAEAGGDDARRALYKGQGNDPYWHGVFGGLYLPHLREAAYASLLEAEALSSAPLGWSEFDGDADGRPEIYPDRPGFRILGQTRFRRGARRDRSPALAPQPDERPVAEARSLSCLAFGRGGGRRARRGPEHPRKLQDPAARSPRPPALRLASPVLRPRPCFPRRDDPRSRGAPGFRGGWRFREPALRVSPFRRGRIPRAAGLHQGGDGSPPAGCPQDDLRIRTPAHGRVRNFQPLRDAARPFLRIGMEFPGLPGGSRFRKGPGDSLRPAGVPAPGGR